MTKTKAHSWIIPKVQALMGAHRQDPAAYWHGLRELARPFLTTDCQHLRFWRVGSDPFNPRSPLMEPDELWLREMVATSEEIIRMHPPAAPLKPWLRLLREAETQSHAPIGDVLDQAVRFVDSLDPSDVWLLIAAAADRAGLTLETVRGWVRRKEDPIPTKLIGPHSHVRLADVLAERDAKAASERQPPGHHPQPPATMHRKQDARSDPKP